MLRRVSCRSTVRLTGSVGRHSTARLLTAPLRCVASSPPPPNNSAALDLSSANIGVSFSAGGLMFPYFVGVVDELTKLGIMSRGMPLAGSSAGSLIAACYNAGLPPAFILDVSREITEDCRVNGTVGRLQTVVKAGLERHLPEDAHELCSGNTFVGITQLTPRPAGLLVSEFETRDDLISALLTSCHIPLYMNTKLTNDFRGATCVDGGVMNFIPELPDVDRTVKVACFPATEMSSVFKDISIAPDLYGTCPYPFWQMVSWALSPSTVMNMDAVVELGRTDAIAWAGLQQPGADEEEVLQEVADLQAARLPTE